MTKKLDKHTKDNQLFIKINYKFQKSKKIDFLNLKK